MATDAQEGVERVAAARNAAWAAVAQRVTWRQMSDPETLAGFADLCGAPGGLPASAHVRICAEALEAIFRDWETHQFESDLLAATLHRLSWALQNQESPLTHKTADVCRVAQGFEAHAHGLLPLRSSGLTYSKENRYVPAWLSFAELRTRLTHFERSYRTRENQIDAEVIREFQEVQQQCLLAETGTAARTVEDALVNWWSETRSVDKRWRRLRYHEAFNTLERGVHTGTQASAETLKLDTSGQKTFTKAAIPSWSRRPAVMTARCHLELAALARVVEWIGVKAVPAEAASWDDYFNQQVAGFQAQYAAAHDAATIDFDDQHVRELVQLRLHAELLLPNLDVPGVAPRADVKVPPCLQVADADRDALASWLLVEGHNASVVLSLSAPEYLAWMQEISGDPSLVDWMLDPAHDPLRRYVNKKTEPWSIPEARRIELEQVREEVVTIQQQCRRDAEPPS